LEGVTQSEALHTSDLSKFFFFFFIIMMIRE
jgi:hypothetical protein